MSNLPPHARAWLEQRQSGAKAVEEIEKQELAALSDDDALRQSETLLSAARLLAREVDEQRCATSGFVEQQRMFARLREREQQRDGEQGRDRDRERERERERELNPDRQRPSASSDR